MASTPPAPFLAFAEELEQAKLYPEVVLKLRSGEYEKARFLAVATLVSDLVKEGAPCDLLARASRTDMIVRPSSPMADPQTQQVVAAAMYARQQVADYDQRDGIDERPRLEQELVTSVRPAKVGGRKS